MLAWLQGARCRQNEPGVDRGWSSFEALHIRARMFGDSDRPRRQPHYAQATQAHGVRAYVDAFMMTMAAPEAMEYANHEQDIIRQAFSPSASSPSHVSRC